jgi:hypothetical protein
LSLITKTTHGARYDLSPISPPPQGAALDATIDEVLEGMRDEQRAEPRFYPDNYPAWNTFFRRRYERELAAYDGPPSSCAQQRRRPPLLVERTRPHPRGRSRAHRARELACPRDAAVTATDAIAAPRELVDATADGIPILRAGVLRVGLKVGITVVGIDAEDREAGAAVRVAEAQQRRPRHP